MSRSDVISHIPYAPRNGHHQDAPSSPFPPQNVAGTCDDNYTPKTYAMDLLAAAHSELPPAFVVEYVHSLRRLAAELGDEPLTRWGLFAGGGIAGKVNADISTFLRHEYAIDIRIPSEVMAEKEAEKLEFIQIHHDDLRVLSADVAGLVGCTCCNILTGNPRHVLPDCWLLDGGIPCVSRTSVNMNCAKNIDCVQRKTQDATSKGFEHTNQVVVEHSPKMAWLECVKNLTQTSSPDNKSDAEYMRDKLRDAMGWAHYAILDAEHFGARIPRIRCLWAALRNLRGNDAEITAWFDMCCNHLKTKTPLHNLGDFIAITDAERTATAKALNFTLLKDLGLRDTKSNVANPEYKLEHLEIMPAFGISWPMDIASVSTRSKICFAGLLPREREVAVFLDNVFEPKHDLEIIDINPTLARLLASHWEVQGVSFKADATPFESGLTVIGSGKLVLRYKFTGSDIEKNFGSEYGMRVLEGWEVMRMSGWSDTYWNTTADNGCNFEAHELCSNISGNSYCIYQTIPWQMALFSTFGKFVAARGEHVMAAEHEDREEGDVESISPPSSP